MKMYRDETPHKASSHLQIVPLFSAKLIRDSGVSFNNEVNFDQPTYQADALPRLQNIDSRIAAMDTSNISISVLMFGPD